MADDTRKGPSSGNPQKLPPPNMKPQITEYIKRPENANLLAGGTENTAGGKTPDIPSLGEIAKSIKIEEFKEVHQKPCVRESLLTGMGSGFAVGGIRAVLGGTERGPSMFMGVKGSKFHKATTDTCNSE